MSKVTEPNRVDPIADKNMRRLGRRVLAVYKENDDDAQYRAKKEGAVCTKGCSNCCYSMMMVSLPEAVAIAEKILTDKTMWVASMEALLAKIYRQLEMMSDPSKAPADGKVPCIFLNPVENTCDIYNVRPAACRYHYVKSDPESCRVDLNLEVDKLNMVDLEEKVRAAAVKVAKQTQSPLGMSPLPVALAWGLKALTEGQGVLGDSKNEALGVLSLKFWEDALGMAAESTQSQLILTDAEPDTSSDSEDEDDDS